jgi:predicted RNA binding protein YcfA (HicA-like mRNA interferase family)
MSRRKLFSSAQVVAALERDGFEPKRRSKTGSHQTWHKHLLTCEHKVTVVPLGKKEIPKGTFESILDLAGIDYDRFLVLARVKRKGKR